MNKQNANWGFVRIVEPWRNFSAMIAISEAAAKQVSALDEEGRRMEVRCHWGEGYAMP
tara:strand:- start:101 stop:274 length:174 start_codon:yes stop_codon:yes gene_type:complete